MSWDAQVSRHMLLCEIKLSRFPSVPFVMLSNIHRAGTAVRLGCSSAKSVKVTSALTLRLSVLRLLTPKDNLNTSVRTSLG